MRCRTLSLVAGTSIVADYCFWLSARASGSTISEATLMDVLHTGIKAYQQELQEVVIDSIHSMAGGGTIGEIVKLVLQYRLSKPAATVLA